MAYAYNLISAANKNITTAQDVFSYHLKQAGMFIGVGTFRPRNGGYFGRFEVSKFDWSEISNDI